MKLVVLIGDGMADRPISTLSGRTPLQAAHKPSMDLIARLGRTGMARTVPAGMVPGSDVANLSVLGYDPHQYYSGRAPLEAAAMGVSLGDDDIAFRCNLVTVNQGKMSDYSAGQISSQEGRELIAALEPFMPGARLYAGVSYRNLLVLKAGSEAFCTPPHDISDQPIQNYLPRGKDSEILIEFMEKSRAVLASHPVNLKRIAEGKKPANMIWLWGQGRAPSMPAFQNKYGLKGAVISAVDLLKGLGACAGMEVVNVAGATGTIDTNYAGKVKAALEALKRVDLVYTHIEAPDEAAHAGDVEQKVKAIEIFDQLVVSPMLKGLSKRGQDWRVLLLPDHATPIETKTHSHDPVPFAIMGQGINPDSVKKFDENAAKLGGYGLVEAKDLIGLMMAEGLL